MPTDDLVEVGNLIRKWRENINMTQIELSERAGLGEKTISRLEMGKSNMRIDTFFTLAEALDITLNDISPARLTSKRKNRRFSDLETKFNHLSEKQKQLVYDTIVSLMKGLENLN
jgi:transcriptional regulator with XRE-family HTH domain